MAETRVPTRHKQKADAEKSVPFVARAQRGHARWQRARPSTLPKRGDLAQRGKAAEDVPHVGADGVGSPQAPGSFNPKRGERASSATVRTRYFLVTEKYGFLQLLPRENRTCHAWPSESFRVADHKPLMSTPVTAMDAVSPCKLEPPLSPFLENSSSA